MLNSTQFTPWSIFLILVLGSTSSILGALKYLDGSQWMMPKEYKVAKNTLLKVRERTEIFPEVSAQLFSSLKSTGVKETKELISTWLTSA